MFCKIQFFAHNSWWCFPIWNEKMTFCNWVIYYLDRKTLSKNQTILLRFLYLGQKANRFLFYNFQFHLFYKVVGKFVWWYLSMQKRKLFTELYKFLFFNFWREVLNGFCHFQQVLLQIQLSIANLYFVFFHNNFIFNNF